MKFNQIQEASYLGQQHKWYVLSDEGDFKLVVGPFKTFEDAGNYATEIEKKYGSLKKDHVPVTLVLEPVECKTPEEFDKSIEDHYRWLNED